jgi:hypothetical protein
VAAACLPLPLHTQLVYCPAAAAAAVVGWALGPGCVAGWLLLLLLLQVAAVEACQLPGHVH